ncbi:MAG: transporter substrate-binding domain-containing protein [Eubacteriales bacterium]|nr:transporter substrate-binding domain-containing protein [Eubacteriales bacterium]
MQRFKKTGVLVLALFFVLAAMPGKAAASGKTLRVGVREDIMHMGYLNSNTGKYYGLEIDLADKLAEILGYTAVEYTSVNPENRKDMLLTGEVDCLIAAYSVEATRLENFDFSPAYYTDYSCVMVEKSSLIHELSDLVGKKTGVLEGANTAPKLYQKMLDMELLTEEDSKGSSLIKLASYEEMSVALEEGTVDAVCMDGCIARAYMEDDREILEETVGQEEYAVATLKDSELSQPVAEAIQRMLDDGTIEGLIEKWN